MLLQDKIEHYLKEIRVLEESFQTVQGQEILPLSFFSSSIDILNSIRTGIYEIEAIQLQMMQEHLKKNEQNLCEVDDISETNGTKNPMESVKLTKRVELANEQESKDKQESKPEEEKTLPGAGVLADTIGRVINSDFSKSLSLNDRFMFQRDLFQGNADEMNHAFAQLNGFQHLADAMDYLNNNYSISWDGDSGVAFKELLDKRFA